MKNSKPIQSESRRQFLGQSAALATGAVMATTSTAGAAHVHVAGSDTLRIGLVGCGGRGAGAVMDSLSSVKDDSIRLVAVADVFEDRVNRTVEAVQKAKPTQVQITDDNRFIGFDSYKQIMESEVDMVILTTPPGFRPLHFEAAVAAGKHVFMEKPVAVDSNGVRRVLAANESAKEKNLLVQVGLQRRHESRYQETIEQLQSGIIGDIVLMRAYWNGDTPWVNPRNEDQTELEYQMRNWYFFNWLCGDHIVEQHIHNLDVINWLKGGYPVSAQGQGGRQIRTGIDHGQIFDHHFVEFTYADGSVMLSQCRHQPGTWSHVHEYAQSSQGFADIAAGVIRDASGKEVFKSSGTGGGHQQEHRDLIADFRDGKRPNEGDYGALSTMTAIMGRMATYSGRMVKWETALNMDFSLGNVDNLRSLDDEAPLQPDEHGRYPIAIPGQEMADKL